MISTSSSGPLHYALFRKKKLLSIGPLGLDKPLGLSHNEASFYGGPEGVDAPSHRGLSKLSSN